MRNKARPEGQVLLRDYLSCRKELQILFVVEPNFFSGLGREKKTSCGLPFFILGCIKYRIPVHEECSRYVGKGSVASGVFCCSAG